jgi:stalled ribosome alternative rescue factor ArfA
MESQENGGVRLSEGNVESQNTILLEVGLLNAQNRSRNTGFGFYNDYNLIAEDSSNIFLNISHEIEWNRVYRTYSDTTTTFYENYFLDDFQTADSSFSQLFGNTILLNFFDNEISVGARNEQYHYFQNFLIDENFESNYFLAVVNHSLFRQKVEITFEKGLSGYNKNELEWNTSIYFQEWRGIETQLKLAISKKQPDYFLQNQRTNHFSFSSEFNTSNQSNLSLLTKIKKWNTRIEAGIREYTNYIYFDTTQLPKQLEESFTNLFFKIDFKLEFLRHMNLKNIILIQELSRTDVVPLPAFTSYHSLYYENSILREALGFQIGSDLRIIGSYGGYKYSPSLTQFYLNENSSQLGDIYQVDLFLNMRVNKSARITIKMENVLGKSFSEDSYRIDGYSIPGKSIKVGFTWRMIN